MFYILIFQWVCWQILFAFWSEHVFRPGVYNSAIYQVLVERETETDRQTDSLSLSLSLSLTHTHTHRKTGTQKDRHTGRRRWNGCSKLQKAPVKLELLERPQWLAGWERSPGEARCRCAESLDVHSKPRICAAFRAPTLPWAARGSSSSPSPRENKQSRGAV